jgi:hypothetical protein
MQRTTLPRHGCDACDGAGKTRDWDHDAEAYVSVRCEACDACGEIGTCSDCFECAAGTELDENGGVCLICASGQRQYDEEADRYRLAVTR